MANVYEIKINGVFLPDDSLGAKRFYSAMSAELFARNYKYNNPRLKVEVVGPPQYGTQAMPEITHE